MPHGSPTIVDYNLNVNKSSSWIRTSNHRHYAVDSSVIRLESNEIVEPSVLAFFVNLLTASRGIQAIPSTIYQTRILDGRTSVLEPFFRISQKLTEKNPIASFGLLMTSCLLRWNLDWISELKNSFRRVKKIISNLQFSQASFRENCDCWMRDLWLIWSLGGVTKLLASSSCQKRSKFFP